MGNSIAELSSVTRVGLGLSKNVFQVHGVDAKGELTRKLRRGALAQFFARLAPCVVATEVCSSAHHWARALIELGHEVRLIPPAYVKPLGVLRALRRDHAGLGQMPAQGVDQRGALASEQFPRPMAHQLGLAIVLPERAK